MKRIIFVDDDTKVLEGLRRLMRVFRDRWRMEFYNSAVAALENLEKEPADVVVSDIRMPVMDGVEFLKRVQQRWPATIRLALSGQCDRQAVLRAVGPTHQFLSKPCDPDLLRKTLVRLCDLRDRVLNEKIRGEVSRVAAFPVLAQTLNRLRALLNREDVNINLVARLMASDLGISAKIIQLVSSSFFGGQHPACLPEEAAKVLGLDVLRPLVLETEVFVPLDLDPELVRLGTFYNQLCQVVALTAWRIAESEKKDTVFCTHCYLGGLLVKVGAMIFATLDIRKYHQIVRVAIEHGGELRQLETQLYGVNRAQVGAYLLALWGLPEPVVDAVHYADRPAIRAEEGFSPLTTVHVAERLVNRFVGAFTATPLQPDDRYLDLIGCKDRLSDWEDIARCTVHEVWTGSGEEAPMDTESSPMVGAKHE